MPELSLTINKTPIPPYAFSLNGDVSEYTLNNLNVNTDDEVIAQLKDDANGSFTVGPDPYFTLSAGFEPDKVFQSPSIKSGSGELFCPEFYNGQMKINRNLFQQVYGVSRLQLCYWSDHANRPNESRVVLAIQITGNIHPRKVDRFNALSDFFQDRANGYFLRDYFHGNTIKKFDLIYRPGYTSYSDPVIEFDCINSLLNDAFIGHLRGVIKHPTEAFHSKQILRRASQVRRLSPKSWQKVCAYESDDVSVLEGERIPSFHAKSNNVISTFLNKLHVRLMLIRSELVQRHKHEASEYQMAQRAANQNGRPHSYEISLMETEHEVLQKEIVLRCKKLISILRGFLNNPVFVYSTSRRELVFSVPSSEFQQTEDYRFLYRAIFRFELTHFYWSGDRHSVFKLPRFSSSSSSGSDFWIRKYSMLYEYWCYLRIHQVLCDLGFITTDIPGVESMRKSDFTRNNLLISLYHDVNGEQNNTDHALYYPDPPGDKTPDFVLVFTNTKSTVPTFGLVTLDAKSNDRVEPYMSGIRNTYLDTKLDTKTGGMIPKPIVQQSWIILSGEAEQGKGGIECPPVSLPPVDEMKGMSKKNKTLLRNLIWNSSASEFQSGGTTNVIGMGYLRTRIKTKNDTTDTDQFKLFLDAQVKLMERLLV